MYSFLFVTNHSLANLNSSTCNIVRLTSRKIFLGSEAGFFLEFPSDEENQLMWVESISIQPLSRLMFQINDVMDERKSTEDLKKERKVIDS